MSIRCIPLHREPSNIPWFPRYPQLYLEFIENKQKLDVSKRGSEYIPRPIGHDECTSVSDMGQSILSRQSPGHPPRGTPSATYSPGRSPDRSPDQSPNQSPNRSPRSPAADIPLDFDSDGDDDPDLDDPSLLALGGRPFSKKPLGGLPAVPPPASQLGITPQQRNIHVAMPEVKPPPENPEKEKQRLLYKLSMLKRQYQPKDDMPEFTMRSDLDEIRRTYEMWRKKLVVDYHVEQYKCYLLGAFTLVELGITKLFKADMSGYAAQQARMIHTYEMLLIELSEQSYVAEDSSWPVELRMLGMIGMNTVLFLLGKKLIATYGIDIMPSIASMWNDGLGTTFLNSFGGAAKSSAAD